MRNKRKENPSIFMIFYDVDKENLLILVIIMEKKTQKKEDKEE